MTRDDPACACSGSATPPGAGHRLGSGNAGGPAENLSLRGEGECSSAGVKQALEQEARVREALLFMLEDLEENRRAIEQAHRDWMRSVDAVRDPIMVHDANFRILRANRAYAQRAGLDFRDMIGKPYWEFFPKGAGPLASCRRNTATIGGEAHDESIAEEITLDTGETFVSRGFSARDEAGRFINALHIFEDITERKRAAVQLTRLNWALRALGQSNSALVHAGTEKELFQSCCDAIAGAGGYPLAWIGLLRDDAARSVAVAAAAGGAIEYMQDFEVPAGGTPHGGGPTGTAIRTGVTQVINNLAASDVYLPWSKRARAHGLASSISLPIRIDGATMGSLVVYGRDSETFAQPEVALFEELAADIGYGVASRRIRTERDHLQQEQLLGVKRLKSALIGTIGAVALMVEKRDAYTAGHQRRVAELSVAIGRQMDLPEDCLEGLRVGATIHDIGKISVPAEILSRPGTLTALEFEIIKSHPQVGYDIVKDVKFPWPVTDMILQHHERLDGSGYPQGLKLEQIVLEARIIAIADVVEAMSSHRPYRPGLGIVIALAEIERGRGTLYDALVADACLKLFRENGYALPG